MNSGKKLVQLGFASMRQFSAQQVRMQSEAKLANYDKLKAKQQQFQLDNGELIHEKGGIFDKLMYQLTLALCAVGLGLSGKVLYDLSCPPQIN